MTQEDDTNKIWQRVNISLLKKQRNKGWWVKDPDTEDEVEKELLPPKPNMPTDDDAFSIKR